MRLGETRPNTRLDRPGERGQAIVLVLLALGLFLIGMVAVAVDFTNLWFRRQAAQSAADSACVAGMVDVLALLNGAQINPHFSPGTAFNCSSTHPNTNTSTAPTPCWYAQANGFSTAGLTGNPPREVAVTFPGSITGVTTPGAAIAPNPFIQVVTEEKVRVYFAGLFSGKATQIVRTSARCGLRVEMSFPPILVLRPTGAGTFRVNGTAHAVSIYGGPRRGIQVNSNDLTTATSLPSGCSDIMLDLSQGGPDLSGSDVGIFGGPLPPAPCSYDPGTTGRWLSPASPMADPLLTLPAPATKPANGTITTVAAGTNGCPAGVTNGCKIYEPGAYNGITIQGSATNIETALFKPGLYWVENQMAIKGNSCVRNWDSGNPLDGTTFYFADNQSIDVASNGGLSCASAGMPLFNANSSKCDVSLSQIPGNLAGVNFTDTVLLAPCTGTYGDPQGASNPTGMQRGVLFFQNRSRDLTAGGSKPPVWQGGGNFLLVGTLYFHQCTTGGAVDAGGTGCNPTSAYKTHFTFQADGVIPGALIGNIITDELTVGGNLILDVVPSAGLIAIKASLVR